MAIGKDRQVVQAGRRTGGGEDWWSSRQDWLDDKKRQKHDREGRTGKVDVGRDSRQALWQGRKGEKSSKIVREADKAGGTARR